MNSELMLKILENIEAKNWYFESENRKWEPLIVISKTPVCSIDGTFNYLSSIGICDETGLLNPMFLNTGCFLSFKSENDKGTGELTNPRIEYLISPMGLQFLEELNNLDQDTSNGVSTNIFIYSNN